MKRLNSLLLAAAVAAMFCTGCASVVHGFTPAGIQIRSDPNGARILLDGENVGTTPKTILPSNRGEHTLRLEKDGYQPVETTVVKSVDHWIWGNFLIGGLIGFTIDSVDGHWSKCRPNEWDVALMPASERSKGSGTVPSDFEREDAVPAALDYASAGPNPELDALLDEVANENQKETK